VNRNQAREAGRQLLGDRVAAGLQKIGADRVAQVYERVTGKPCGCAGRMDWLNQLDQKWRGRRE
jgi:hypothetical protein